MILNTFGWIIIGIASFILYVALLNILCAIAERNEKKAAMYASIAKLVNKLADATGNSKGVIKSFKKGDDAGE